MFGEVFDPKREWMDRQGARPHWAQAGTVVFITFGAADAIPRHVLALWDRERRDWLSRRGVTGADHWSVLVSSLTPELRETFHREFARKRERELDQCRGECVLKIPELAEIVAGTLHHFDCDRYRLGDYVVMPNHVHLLVTFPNPETLRTQCDSWLHYSAMRINKALGRRGRFWRSEPFDHLVRSPEQLEALRRYIAENPVRAGLRDGEYLLRRWEES
jgi:putative transposase